MGRPDRAPTSPGLVPGRHCLHPQEAVSLCPGADQVLLWLPGRSSSVSCSWENPGAAVARGCGVAPRGSHCGLTGIPSPQPDSHMVGGGRPSQHGSQEARQPGQLWSRRGKRACGRPLGAWETPLSPDLAPGHRSPSAPGPRLPVCSLNAPHLTQGLLLGPTGWPRAFSRAPQTRSWGLWTSLCQTGQHTLGSHPENREEVLASGASHGRGAAFAARTHLLIGIRSTQGVQTINLASASA